MKGKFRGKTVCISPRSEAHSSDRNSYLMINIDLVQNGRRTLFAYFSGCLKNVRKILRMSGGVVAATCFLWNDSWHFFCTQCKEYVNGQYHIIRIIQEMWSWLCLWQLHVHKSFVSRRPPSQLLQLAYCLTNVLRLRGNDIIMQWPKYFCREGNVETAVWYGWDLPATMQQPSVRLLVECGSFSIGCCLSGP